MKIQAILYYILALNLIIAAIDFEIRMANYKSIVNQFDVKLPNTLTIPYIFNNLGNSLIPFKNIWSIGNGIYYLVVSKFTKC